MNPATLLNLLNGAASASYLAETFGGQGAQPRLLTEAPAGPAPSASAYPSPSPSASPSPSGTPDGDGYGGATMTAPTVAVVGGIILLLVLLVK